MCITYSYDAGFFSSRTFHDISDSFDNSFASVGCREVKISMYSSLVNPDNFLLAQVVKMKIISNILENGKYFSLHQLDLASDFPLFPRSSELSNWSRQNKAFSIFPSRTQRSARRRRDPEK